MAATGVECSVANSLRLIRLLFADARERHGAAGDSLTLLSFPWSAAPHFCARLARPRSFRKGLSAHFDAGCAIGQAVPDPGMVAIRYRASAQPTRLPATGLSQRPLHRGRSGLNRWPTETASFC